MSLNIGDAKTMLDPLFPEKKLAIFVGSGVSVPSGLPTWDGLLEKFVEFCESYERSLGDTELHDLLDDARRIVFGSSTAAPPRSLKSSVLHPERVISALKHELTRLEKEKGIRIGEDFGVWLVQTLSGKPNNMHKSIVSTNYSYILTSNYDKLLEDAARELSLTLPSYSHHDSEQVRDLAAAIYNHRSCIIHAHGNLWSIVLNEMVLTSQDYASFAKKYGGFTLLLQTIFATQSILFVGYGASDPHFEYILEELTTLFDVDSSSSSLPRYFLVVKKDKVGKVFEKYKRAFATAIIEVDDYSECDILLAEIQKSNPRT